MKGRLQNQLRPKLLTQFFGLDSAELLALFAADRAPHGWLLSGDAGTGKTTLAAALALCYQFSEGKTEKGASIDDFSISVRNAGDLTGVDAMRDLIRQSEILPMAPSKARVFILDEAHALSAAAQKSLLRPTESGPGIWILCTTDPGKLSRPLRDRCYSVNLRALASRDVPALMKRAAKAANFSGSMKTLFDALKQFGEFRPRAVINACEKFFAGATPDRAVVGADDEGIEVIQVCRAVARGNRKRTLQLIEGADVAQLRSIRLATLSYLRKVLGSGESLASIAIRKLAAPLPPEDPASAALISAQLYDAAETMSRKVS